MDKHKEILSKYVETSEFWAKGDYIDEGWLTKENALKAMQEVVEMEQKDFAEFLAECTEVIREEKITLYRHHDNSDGWANYTLDDIFIVYQDKK